MVIELYDHNAVFMNELIGQYTINLATMYNNIGHEFWKTWVGVFHKDDPNKVQAYLLFDAYIIGPNQKPPAHSPDEEPDDELPIDSDDDEEDIARKIESIKRAQGCLPVDIPQKINKSWQLNVVVGQAEDLIPCNDRKQYYPFVSARAFGMVLATKAGGKKDPRFDTKLSFPVYYPILNNKITVRVWNETTRVARNVYIGNIPEHPTQTDLFNITQLMANDGRMPALWMNLYGTPPLERSERTKRRREGSAYLGRVLIALNMISNEKPQLMSQPMPDPVTEPRTRLYKMWVEFYDIIRCQVIEPGSKIYAMVTVGKYWSPRAYFKYKAKYDCYRYKEQTMPQFPDPEDKGKDKDGWKLPHAIS